MGTSNKLRNNFAGLVTSCIGPDVACEPKYLHSTVMDDYFNNILLQ